MTFGEKFRELRTGRGMTQEELAERLYVTRAAISKWETGRGFPAIDSLVAIKELFGVCLDDLVTGGDAERKRAQDERTARRFYLAAVVCLAVVTALTLLGYFLKIRYFAIASAVGSAGYVVCGLYSRPKYRRLRVRALVLPYVISRAVVLAFVVGMIVWSLATL